MVDAKGCTGQRSTAQHKAAGLFTCWRAEVQSMRALQLRPAGNLRVCRAFRPVHTPAALPPLLTWLVAALARFLKRRKK